MDINLQKEFFSYAYVRAVAAVAGFSVQEKTRPMDNVGLDLTIEVPGEVEGMDCPKFDAQVKCTSKPLKIVQEEFISFNDLPVKNYNRLRANNPLVPQIIIVVLVPTNKPRDWINVSEERMVLKKCGYWASLKGKPPTTNSEKITVHLPKINLFTPDNLTQIIEKIAKGEEL